MGSPVAMCCMTISRRTSRARRSRSMSCRVGISSLALQRIECQTEGRNRERGCQVPAREWVARREGESHTLHSVKVRDVIAELESNGWRLVRTRGSHRQFRHPSKPGTVTVSGKSSIDVPIGTLGSIWKQAGLKKS
ncbi:MAG TPA: type II toxin-antitoxin system HicA family toxin [Thermoanaerobaculia bacterium]